MRFKNWYLCPKCVLSFICAVCLSFPLCYVYLQRPAVSTVRVRASYQLQGLTARHPEQPVVSMTGGGGLDAQVTGGQLVLLHVRFCLFFISGFQKKKYLTVINRQQVALFLFFV